MLLAIDIGNTNIVFGLYESGAWQSLRQETETVKSVDGQRKIMAELLGHKPLARVKDVIISSVVPAAVPVVCEASKALSQAPILVIGPAHYDQLPIEIKNPEEIGTDLVCNAISAYELFKSDCMVIDFGTALTFTVIANKKLLGVNIAPGIKTAMKALVGNAAQLKEIPLALPESVLGTDTATAIQSGILWGYVGLVERMIDRIAHEMDKPLKIVATGGLSKILAPLEKRFDKVDKNLTLEGMRLVFGSQASPL